MKYVPKLKAQHTVISVPLGEEAVHAYRQMAEESLLELSNSDAIGDLPITRVLRLAQISGGFVRDEDGAYHRVHFDLQRAFKDWLLDRKEEGHTKLVVFARFKKEIKDIAETVAHAGFQPLLLHGGVSGARREQRIAEFDETREPTVFISQVSAGREGIDLSAATIAVYYSIPTDLVSWDQSHARITRFKDKQTRAYYYFVPTLPTGSSVAEITIASLKAGKDLAETMDRDPYMVFESAL
jgi:superfamily II DNA/RNA helicase